MAVNLTTGSSSTTLRSGLDLKVELYGIDMPYPHTVVLLEQQPNGPAIVSRPALKNQPAPGGMNGQKL